MAGHYMIIIFSLVPTSVAYFLLAINTNIRTDKIVGITSALFPPTFLLLTFFFDDRPTPLNYGTFLLIFLMSAFLYITMPYSHRRLKGHEVMDKTRERWRRKYKKN